MLQQCTDSCLELLENSNCGDIEQRVLGIDVFGQDVRLRAQMRSRIDVSDVGSVYFSLKINTLFKRDHILNGVRQFIRFTVRITPLVVVC